MPDGDVIAQWIMQKPGTDGWFFMLAVLAGLAYLCNLGGKNLRQLPGLLLRGGRGRHNHQTDWDDND